MKVEIVTLTMAQPTHRSKELNLNKPEAFDGNRDGFKKFYKMSRYTWTLIMRHTTMI
jgi:hypothetical protein